VLSNDSDADGDSLTAVLVSNGSNGVASLNADGSFTYTPTANFNGVDSFTYRANDGTVNSNLATVTITVNATNDVPVAVDDAYSTNEDVVLTIAATGVLFNDSDADGDSLTAVLVSNGSNGVVNLNADGSFTYIPDANFNGTDSFTYRANDGTVNSNLATVTITVSATNDVPVAVDNAYSTNEDVVLTIAATGVLANDSDADGDSLTAILVSNALNGSASLNADGSFTYTPTANFNGVDSFTYRATDGTADSNLATVTITVVAVNDAPVANSNTHTVPEETQNHPLGLNAPTDIEGDSLTITVSGLPSASEGIVTLIDGTALAIGQTLSSTQLQGLQFDGALDFVGGPAIFSYLVDDGSLTASGTSQITLTQVNDSPIVDSNSHTVAEGTLDFPLGLDAPTDVDGDSLSLTVTAVPALLEGTVTLANGTALSLGQTLSSADLEGLQLDLATGFDDGIVTFAYEVSDGTVTVSGSSIVTVVNAAPVALDDVATTDEDVAVTIDILANDSDPGSDLLELISATAPANGNIVINNNDTITYTPSVGFTGLDSFNYVISDGEGASDAATVTVAVGEGLFVQPPAHAVSCVANSFLFVASLGNATDVTYTIDWDGDGSIDETIDGSNLIKVQHDFGITGTFDIQVTATDNNSGTILNTTFTLDVNVAGVVDGDVYACGDALPNRIIGSSAGSGRVLVRVDGYTGIFLPGPGGRFIALGLGSRDRIGISGNLLINAVVDGGDGADNLAAGRGDDTLSGGSGNDIMLGGEGTNTFFGEDGNDRLSGRSGVDIMYGGFGNDFLDGGSGDDVLVGGQGNDQVTGGPGNDILRGDFGNDILSGQGGNDLLIGGEGNDSLNGDAGTDILIGSDGTDRLRGGADQDVLIGGSTDLDENDSLLQDALADWSNLGFDVNLRIDNIKTGVSPLTPAIIRDDGDIDGLAGDGVFDFHLAHAGDIVTAFGTGDSILFL
jgi:VCBS repeat-containing protein